SADMAARSKEINRMIQQEKNELDKVRLSTVKLLLLGPGESGKSTVVKQMKLMNGIKFTAQELDFYRTLTTKNVIACAKALVKAMDQLKIPYGFDPAVDVGAAGFGGGGGLGRPTAEKESGCVSREELVPGEAAGVSRKNSGEASLTDGVPSPGLPDASASNMNLSAVSSSLRHEGHSAADLVEGVVALGGDPVARAAQAAYDLAIMKVGQVPQVGVVEGLGEKLDREGVEAVSFMNNLDRVTDSNFVPTEADILQCRVQTTSVTETVFKFNNTAMFHVYDVGGQRTHRKKWAPYFQDVNAIIFVIAIMVEALNLFGTICNHPLFKKTSMIVFLNKIDLFKDKIKTNPVSRYFPNCTGTDYEAGCLYFTTRVQELNKYKEKKIYTYRTFATDSTQISTILASVNRILMDDQLTGAGL
ncbi:hypothetical protein HDU98_005289, partial [Podochytrium sp. JEL0797]